MGCDSLNHAPLLYFGELCVGTHDGTVTKETGLIIVIMTNPVFYLVYKSNSHDKPSKSLITLFKFKCLIFARKFSNLELTFVMTIGKYTSEHFTLLSEKYIL